MQGFHRLPTKSPSCIPARTHALGCHRLGGTQAVLHPGLQRMLVWVPDPPTPGVTQAAVGHTHKEGQSRLSLPPIPAPSCSPENPGQDIRVSWWKHSYEHLASYRFGFISPDEGKKAAHRKPSQSTAIICQISSACLGADQTRAKPALTMSCLLPCWEPCCSKVRGASESSLSSSASPKTFQP